MVEFQQKFIENAGGLIKMGKNVKSWQRKYFLKIEHKLWFMILPGSKLDFIEEYRKFIFKWAFGWMDKDSLHDKQGIVFDKFMENYEK